MPLPRTPVNTMNDSTSIYPSCGLFRVRAIPIVARRPLRHGEHQQHYSSDQRYQVYEYPPARAVYVVEPPYGHGQARDEDGQAVDPAQQPCAGIGAAGAKQGVDPRQHYGYYDVEEHEVPVLLAPGSATEHGILLECFKVPTQLTASPSPRSLGAHCDGRILARGAKACIQQRTG